MSLKLAVVTDFPRSSRLGEAYFQKVLRGVEKVAGTAVEVKQHYLAEEYQPKPLGIAAIRELKADLWRQLEADRPDVILAEGAAALNALSEDKAAVTLAKERGRLRYHAYIGAPWMPTISRFAVIAKSDLHRDYADDIWKAVAQRTPLSRPVIEVHVMEDGDDPETFFAALDRFSVISCDVETTGLHPWRADRLTEVGLGAWDQATYTGASLIVPARFVASKRLRRALSACLWRSDRRVVFHNGKFDLQFLSEVIGWPHKTLIGDTMLLHHQLDERPNSPTSRVRGHGLKDLVAVKYDVQYGWEGQWDVDTPEKEAELQNYLAQDTVYTARLWHDLAAEAEKENAAILALHDSLLIPVSQTLARCELRGTPVDRSWLEQHLKEHDTERAKQQEDLVARLAALAPGEEGINVLAPGQVENVMFDTWQMKPDIRVHGRIDTKRSTDKRHIEAAITKYTGTDKEPMALWLKDLLELRRTTKERASLERLLTSLDATSNVHTEFRMHGTVTGRLSSANPNLQNVPAVDRVGANTKAPLRRAFRPSEAGWSWVEADYSQLELRVAAGLSHDDGLTEVFKSGRDVHQEVASMIFRTPTPTKTQRFMAKAVGFGILYGRTPAALASGQEMEWAAKEYGAATWTEEEAESFVRQFLRSYPKLAQWRSDAEQAALSAGEVTSYFGRVRRFPLQPRTSAELGAIRRQAVNTPIQSTASDICLRAMVAIEAKLMDGNWKTRVLFPVHDSICFVAPNEELDRLEVLCRQTMEMDFEGVPLKVDFELGPTWADTGPPDRMDPDDGRRVGMTIDD